MNATGDTTMLTVGGLRVRVAHSRPAGIDAPPKVLVLHGWGASIDAVGSILAGLRDKVELAAVDLPGMGESEMVPAAWGNRDYAAFVVELVDALGFDRFALVGHSRGAAVSIVLASAPATRDRVERMVLTGAAGIKPRRPLSYYVKVGSAKFGRVVGAIGGPPGKRLQQKIRGRAASADWLAAPDALRGTLRTVLAEDVSPLLPQVDAPTLLIWGPDDESTPLWMGEQMEREIPGAALIVLRGGGHFAYAELAGEFNVIASHFLTQGGRR